MGRGRENRDRLYHFIRGVGGPDPMERTVNLRNSSEKMSTDETNQPFESPEQKGLYQLAVHAGQHVAIADEALNLLKGYLDDDTAGGYSRKAVRKRYRELRQKLDELCDFAS